MVAHIVATTSLLRTFTAAGVADTVVVVLVAIVAAVVVAWVNTGQPCSL